MDFNRESLLAMFAPKVVPITVTVGDETANLFVKELSAEQVFELQAKQKDSKASSKTFAIQLVAMSLCEADGTLLMTVEQARDMTKVKVQAFNVLAEQIAVAVGLKKEGEDEKGKA